MRLINFGNADAINELLDRIGIAMKLDEFLAEHLTQVLRNQHPDVVIELIEFVKAGDCSANGMQTSEVSIVSIDSLCIPIDVHIVLVSNSRTHELDIHVRIIAYMTGDAYDIKTDVIIQRQWIV